MNQHAPADARCPHHRIAPHRAGPWRRFLVRWSLANSLLAGAFALAWLVLRSGPKPSRLAYPCQQAAFSSASLAFGVPVAGSILAARRSFIAALRRPVGIALAGVGLLVTLGVAGYLTQIQAGPGAPPLGPGDYRAEVFRVIDCPPDPVGDRFTGLDNLLTLMGHEGRKFYKAASESLLAGPDGIIAAGDTVVIKINYQWAQRGGTNTDLLRGLIRCLVDHPAGFTGEIVVCENAQFASTEGFDRAENNAQDHGLSPHDVVVHFQSLGWRVSHFDWTPIRFVSVAEYSEGDLNDGYVVYPYDAQLHGRISYPKFRTSYGTYISLRDGLWDPGSGAYDRDHLRLINVPVLKSHAIYGVTACVKDYMGVVTRELSTNSHNAIHYGILGGLMGRIRPADLNLLDCIWINAIPNNGPGTPYSAATRRDMLVASRDPVAADIWAVKNILIPAFLENGYLPPFTLADPDDPGSKFRIYLDNSMAQILAAGFDVTNDPSQIDAVTWDGAVGDGDLNGDGCVGQSDLGILLADWNCTGGGCAGDIDYDGDTDQADLGVLLGHFGVPCP